MDEKTKVFQFSIQPSLVDRVKGMGNGKFPAGLYFLLREYDRLQGTVEKHDDQIANKGVRKSEFKEDPRLPRQPGEHQAKYNARLTAYIANLPETIRAKKISGIESRISVWNQHWGKLRADTGEPVNMDDYTKYESEPWGIGMNPGETTFDYITVERMRECMSNGKAVYDTNNAEIAAKEGKPSGPRPKLTADSRHVYQNFPVLMAGLTDAQIDMMNDECDGAIDRGVDPIDPPTAENTN